MGLIKEFKEFAMRGNVVDLAVGVIIGAAFGKIVTSLVNDVVMPPIGKLMGNVNFNSLFINLAPDKRLPDGSVISTLEQAASVKAPVIAYGKFINIAIEFIIVAFCVFMLVKAINELRRRFEKQAVAAPAAPPAPTPSEKLLGEIRDLLKARNP